MKRFESALIVLLVVLSLLAVVEVMPDARAEQASNGGPIGVDVGDWIKYKGKRLGQPWAWVPTPIDKAEWIKVEIRNVTGTIITATETMHLENGNETNKTYSGDVRTGLTEPYIILANIKAGDVFFFGADRRAVMNRTMTKAYNGVIREVNLLNRSYLMPEFEYIYHYSEEYFWDRSTGFLLNQTLETYAVGYENTSKSKLLLSIVETNLWEMHTEQKSNSPQWVPWLLIGITVTAGVYFTISVKRKRKSNDE